MFLDAHLLQRKELADALLSQGGQPPHQFGLQRGVGVSSGGEMMSSTSMAYRWSSCETTWSLLIPAKVNCASGWANDTGGRSAQHGGSCTATLDISAGDELSIVSTLRRGHQCGMSVPEFERQPRKFLMNAAEAPAESGLACVSDGGPPCSVAG
jgi:hypothetical protein